MQPLSERDALIVLGIMVGILIIGVIIVEIPRNRKKALEWILSGIAGIFLLALVVGGLVGGAALGGKAGQDYIDREHLQCTQGLYTVPGRPGPAQLQADPRCLIAYSLTCLAPIIGAGAVIGLFYSIAENIGGKK